MGRISDFFNRIFRKQKALPEAEIDENIEQSENITNKIESEEKDMNEHEKWIEEQKEKDKARRMEEWKNLSEDDKIISILKSRGVDPRILENPAGRKTLLNWAYSNTRKRTVDFDDYINLFGAINLSVDDGKVIDNDGVRDLLPSAYTEYGQNKSTREVSINENGELKVVTKSIQEYIPSHRENGMGKIDEYTDISNTETSVYDKNGLEVSKEEISFTGKKEPRKSIYKNVYARGYKLERGKSASGMLIGNYTVYDDLGADAKDGKLDLLNAKIANTTISLEGQYPDELGGIRPTYEQVKTDLQDIHSYEEGKAKGYVLPPYNKEEQEKIKAYFEKETAKYKEQSSIFKKSFEERSGISNKKDITELGE
jgi:hypothetical protein